MKQNSSKQVDPFYLTKEWKQIRNWVVNRDGFRCVACGRINCRLTVDHIIPRKNLPPDRWYETENLRTLCWHCDGSSSSNFNRGGDGSIQKVNLGVDSNGEPPDWK